MVDSEKFKNKSFQTNDIVIKRRNNLKQLYVSESHQFEYEIKYRAKKDSTYQNELNANVNEELNKYINNKILSKL